MHATTNYADVTATEPTITFPDGTRRPAIRLHSDQGPDLLTVAFPCECGEERCTGLPLSGMIRDGAFLVEDTKVAIPVRQDSGGLHFSDAKRVDSAIRQSGRAMKADPAAPCAAPDPGWTRLDNSAWGRWHAAYGTAS